MNMQSLDNSGLQLTWLGHAMFFIENAKGVKIVTDPYSEKTGYKPPYIEADIVTVSHYHYDHDNVEAVDGNFEVIDKPGSYSIKGISIEGLSSFHDEEFGKLRGGNIIFKFIIDGLVIAHMGDFGQKITTKQEAFLQNVDILCIPVGGTYTIDFKQAAEIVKIVKPKIAIPMHFKTKHCLINIDPPEKFLDLVDNVKKMESEINITPSLLPKETEVWFMDYLQ